MVFQCKRYSRRVSLKNIWANGHPHCVYKGWNSLCWYQIPHYRSQWCSVKYVITMKIPTHEQGKASIADSLEYNVHYNTTSISPTKYHAWSLLRDISDIKWDFKFKWSLLASWSHLRGLQNLFLTCLTGPRQLLTQCSLWTGLTIHDIILQLTRVHQETKK